MGTYKNFHMFTKVDKGIDDYLEHLEKHVGKITGCTNLPEGIFALGDDLERKDIVKKFNSMDPLPERGEPFTTKSYHIPKKFCWKSCTISAPLLE